MTLKDSQRNIVINKFKELYANYSDFRHFELCFTGETAIGGGKNKNKTRKKNRRKRKINSNKKSYLKKNNKFTKMYDPIFKIDLEHQLYFK